MSKYNLMGVARVLLFDQGKMYEKEKLRGRVLHTELSNGFIIDSCKTFDAGFETAINKNDGDTIIVENYETFNQMKKGHDKWIKFAENNPKKAFSIQFMENINFDER